MGILTTLKLLAGALLAVTIGVACPSALAHGDAASQGYGLHGSAWAAVPLGSTFAASPPANDAWASATAISGASGSTTGTNVEATEEPDEQLELDIADIAGASTTGKTVWWKWVAPADGNMTFSTVGSGLADTLIGVFTGSGLPLTEVNASDDSDAGTQSRASFDAVTGTTYYIQVGSFVGETTGQIDLAWQPNPVGNDGFAHPTVLGGSSGETTGTNAGATLELHEQTNELQADTTVWYSWAPGAGPAKVTLTATDRWLAVYTGTQLASLQEVLDGHRAGDDPQVEFTAVAGTTYRIQVGSTHGAAPGAFTLDWATAPGAPSLDVPTAGSNSVGLSWTAPASNGAAITAYKVYRGTSSGGETLLATLGVVTGYTDNTAANGTTYFYKVSAVNSIGEGAQSNERSATPATVPGAPALAVPTAGSNAVQLTWTAPASDGGAAISGYKVYRGTASGGETLLTTVGAVLTYTDTTPVNGTTYFYKVSAVNSAGEGAQSNERSATPVPSPPGERSDPQAPAVVVPRADVPSPPASTRRPPLP